MKSTRHAKNVLKLMPSDLRKTSFRMETLQNNTKTRGADDWQKHEKKHMIPNPWELHPRTQQKTMQQIQKQISKRDSQIRQTKWVYFRGGVSGGTFGGPIHFLTLQIRAQGFQRSSNAGKLHKQKTKSPRNRQTLLSGMRKISQAIKTWE